MPKLKFFDVKTRKSFMTDKFKVRTITVRGKRRRQAVATVPKTKRKAFRFLKSK